MRKPADREAVVKRTRAWIALSILTTLLASCSDGPEERQRPITFQPKAIVDLGALVTEESPWQLSGKKILADNGFTNTNTFDVRRWEQELPGGTISGQNSYYTIYNHGGPHVDAPNHIGLVGGLDVYPLAAFAGPLRVLDVREFPQGFTVPRELFVQQGVLPGDVVAIYTGYEPPQDDDTYPQAVTLTHEASEYLASLPIRAFATDAASVFDFGSTPDVDAESIVAQAAPIHHSFLSRKIPVYEGLFNLDQLLEEDRLFFVGVPVNIQDGDGMIVRPVAFAY